MTRDEFQKKYHDYSTQNMTEAEYEAKKVNEVAEGFIVEPQKFGDLGICLMLSTAKSFINELYPDLKED